MRTNKLRKWRKKLRLTQAELAVAAHCSRMTIILIERLNHYPGSEVRSRLSTALFISEVSIWPKVVTDGDGER